METSDNITITAAEHATYVAAMAEVERLEQLCVVKGASIVRLSKEVEILRAKLVVCYELLHDHGVITSPEFQAAKEACK